MGLSTPWLVGGTAAVIGGLAAAAALLRGDPSRGRRRCGRCWYDMSGVSGLRCPECGREARSERALRRTRRRWGWIAASLVVAAAGGLVWGEHRVGWPQLAPAAVWRAAMPYLDPRAEEELAATGLAPAGPAAAAAPVSKQSRWRRLRHAYRCGLVLDGAACAPTGPGSLPRLRALAEILAAGTEGRIALPQVERALAAANAPPLERQLALTVLLRHGSEAERLALAERTALEDPHPVVRHAAFNAIRAAARREAAPIPALVRMLRAPDARIRRDAAEQVGWHEAHAEGVLPELDRLAAEDPSADVRDLATGAAQRIRAAVREAGAKR